MNVPSLILEVASFSDRLYNKTQSVFTGLVNTNLNGPRLSTLDHLVGNQGFAQPQRIRDVDPLRIKDPLLLAERHLPAEFFHPPKPVNAKNNECRHHADADGNEARARNSAFFATRGI